MTSEICRFGLIVTGEGEEVFLPQFFRVLMKRAHCLFTVIRRVGQRSPISAPKRLLRMVGSGQRLPSKDEEEISLPVLAFLRKYPGSFAIVVDDLKGTIAPFYLPTGIDLRAVRMLRFFRVFRILKFVRYSRAVERFREAFLDIKEELVVYLLGTVTVVFLATVGIYYFENEAQPEAFASVFHAFWWAIVTLTTVDYGDVYPMTVGGKVFASMVLLLGLGIVSVPPALVASALIRKGMRRSEEPASGDND